MDTALNNNYVRIYDVHYNNGSYTTYGNKLLDSYPKESEEVTGVIGCTGDRGAIGSYGECGSTINIKSDSHMINRYPKFKKYKAYCVKIKPKNNSQESYDEVVCPFLDLDDIGVELKVSQPKCTLIKGDINPEYLDRYNDLLNENHIIKLINGYIGEVFPQINLSNIEEIKSSISYVEDNIVDDLIPYKAKLLEITKQIKSDIKDYHRKQETYEPGRASYDYDSDYEYDCEPSKYRYTSCEKCVPNGWYDFHNEVNFNDDTKIIINCHEGTSMYNVIDEFLKQQK